MSGLRSYKLSFLYTHLYCTAANMNGANPIWSQAQAPDGRVYYYNTQTKQTQWTKPEELMTAAEVRIFPEQAQALLTRLVARFVEPAMERVYRRGRPQVLVQHGNQEDHVGDA